MMLLVPIWGRWFRGLAVQRSNSLGGPPVCRFVKEDEGMTLRKPSRLTSVVSEFGFRFLLC